MDGGRRVFDVVVVVVVVEIARNLLFGRQGNNAVLAAAAARGSATAADSMFHCLAGTKKPMSLAFLLWRGRVFGFGFNGGVESKIGVR